MVAINEHLWSLLIFFGITDTASLNKLNILHMYE